MSTASFVEVDSGFEMVTTTNNSPSALASIRQSQSSKKAQDISWSNINYNIGEKKILSDCWGQVPSGKVCAIMGPSGAGKSSLLNVLAGRSSSSANIHIGGLVTVGGVEINPVAFRKNIAYVMQDDALMQTATPREAMRFSATMRLPAETSTTEIEALVDHLLEELGLTVCADVMIGGHMIKGISGGQRKRTSVGIEIITDPSLLFLDEPTSGLDSFSAFNLVNLLKKVAAENCTILCTIHQPSSEVFFLFDIVIYMKDGIVFYQGPVDQIIPFYSQRGCICPENYNPSDFVMNLAQSGSVEELEKRNLFVPVPTDFQQKGESAKEFGEKDEVVMTVQSSFSKQVYALTEREVQSTFRDTGSLITKFGTTIFLSLLYGLIFLGVGGKDNGETKKFNAHTGAISMILISSMFASSDPILLSFPYERPIFLREYTTGTYNAVAYFLSKFAVEAPMTLVQMIVQYLMCYYMMDLQGNFMLIMLAGYGLAMACNSISLCLACLIPSLKDVTELATLLLLPQMLFGGFFIRTGKIPIFLRWAQWLCGLKYSMNLTLLLEFGPSLDSCDSSEAASQNCANLLDKNNIVVDDYYISIIMLFVLFFVVRCLAVVILVQKSKKFY